MPAHRAPRAAHAAGAARATGRQPPGAQHGALLAAGILAVGWFDGITGTDIRVLAVYFIPMAFAGWRLHRLGAVLGAAGAAVVWLLVQRGAGVHYAHEAIWIINLFTQGAAFLTVGGLVADERSSMALADLLADADRRL